MPRLRSSRSACGAGSARTTSRVAAYSRRQRRRTTTAGASRRRRPPLSTSRKLPTQPPWLPTLPLQDNTRRRRWLLVLLPRRLCPPEDLPARVLCPAASRRGPTFRPRPVALSLGPTLQPPRPPPSTRLLVSLRPALTTVVPWLVRLRLALLLLARAPLQPASIAVMRLPRPAPSATSHRLSQSPHLTSPCPSLTPLRPRQPLHSLMCPRLRPVPYQRLRLTCLPPLRSRMRRRPAPCLLARPHRRPSPRPLRLHPPRPTLPLLLPRPRPRVAPTWPVWALVRLLLRPRRRLLDRTAHAYRASSCPRAVASGSRRARMSSPSTRESTRGLL